jgi:hypothetical protein
MGQGGGRSAGSHGAPVGEASQYGEEALLAAALGRLPNRTGWCVEFGAFDGLTDSNTADLVARQGYSAVLIECDRRRAKRLAARYADRDDVITMRAMVGWGPTDRLDVLLAGTPIPKGFDLLSIDVDGNEHHIWAAVDEYRPSLVVVEYNPTIPNGVTFVQPADPRVTQGASISSLVALASSKGYELVATTAVNAVFVVREHLEHFDLDDNSVDALRTDRSWQTQIFFGYDGRAFLVGDRGLWWHGLRTPSQLRMVPRTFTGFPGRFGPLRKGALVVWRKVARRSFDAGGG